VLPAEHRLTDGDLFRVATRRGSRCGSSTLVAHLWAEGSDGPARVGFVVSRAVGNAVVRNRVKRRLRHLAREHVSSLPGSCVLVVRALPAAGTVGADRLRADLDHCLDRLLAGGGRP
jgi:ribonuclease P protein component